MSPVSWRFLPARFQKRLDIPGPARQVISLSSSPVIRWLALAKRRSSRSGFDLSCIREKCRPCIGRQGNPMIRNVIKQAVFCSLGAAFLCTAGCGGGGSTTPVQPVKTTPTVTVAPASKAITTAQSLLVTITASGCTTPTGSVTLSSGSYSSAAVALAAGSATITIPAGALPSGTDTLTAAYTPDASSSSTCNSASGTDSVTVTAVVSIITPNVTVFPQSSSIPSTQTFAGTVSVCGGSGNPTPTGTATLSSGSYTSSAFALTGQRLHYDSRRHSGYWDRHSDC